MILDTTKQPYNYYVINVERGEVKWLYGKVNGNWLFGISEKPMTFNKDKAQEIACKLSLKYGKHYMCVESIYPIGE